MIKNLSAFFINRTDFLSCCRMLILSHVKKIRVKAVHSSNSGLYTQYKFFRTEQKTPPKAGGILILLTIIVFTASRCICFPEEEIPDEITVISWNVCNLFDSTDNGTEYAEFDPSGDEWGRELYLLRLNNTASVLNSIEKKRCNTSSGN